LETRIVITFSSEHDNAKDNVDDVHQLFMRRNPMDEPIIITEGKVDGFWIKD
jgi:hypothetical protein